MKLNTPGKPVSRLSVVICTRNRPLMIHRCIAHLLAGATLPAEIIVVDQSRDEQTYRRLERFQEGPVNLVYVRDPGSGLGRAQNQAFQRASCPVVAVLDDDCVAAPGWVAALEGAFRAEPALDFVAGRVLPYGPEQPGRLAVASRTSTQRIDFNLRAMPWEIGSGNNFAARKEWLLRVGGNDERLGPGAPGQGAVDIDLFYRLLRSGARLRYEPGLVLYHERATPAERRARRSPYGYGMGACCTKWLRQGDLNAVRVLARWFGDRLVRLARGARRGDGQAVTEQLLMLRGTLRGMGYGWQMETSVWRCEPAKRMAV